MKSFFIDLFFQIIFFGLSLDFKVILFNFVLLTVFRIIYFFGLFYIRGYLYYFFYSIFFFRFLLVIFIFNMSLGFHLIFFFWDILGLVSFFLVLYYINWRSLFGAMETIFRNRWGDFFLLYFVCEEYLFINIFLLNFCRIYLYLGILTKSSQFPFYRWLIKAIAAPTPVSSMVHRRTLVVAGCFLIFIFSYKYNYLFSLYVMFVGLLGIFFSSFLSLFEKDIKKIIAWRTISQVGFILFIFSYGWYFYSFLYLLNHALFKRLIFLLVGYKIYYSKGGQDYRNEDNVNFFTLRLVFFFGFISLGGIFFSSGIFIKDYFLELFFCYNISFLFVFRILVVFLTNFYNIKIIFLFFNVVRNSFFYISFFGMVIFFFLRFFGFYLLLFLLKNFFFIGNFFFLNNFFWLLFFLFLVYLFFINLNFFFINSNFLGDYYLRLFSGFFMFVFFRELILFGLIIILSKIFLLFNWLKKIFYFKKIFFLIIFIMMLF